jgi:hypothetical protein
MLFLRNKPKLDVTWYVLVRPYSFYENLVFGIIDWLTFDIQDDKRVKSACLIMTCCLYKWWILIFLIFLSSCSGSSNLGLFYANTAIFILN